MSDQYPHELELVRFLIERVERRLAGRDEDRVVNRFPIDHCRLGVLVPQDRRVDEPEFAEGEPTEEPAKPQPGARFRSRTGRGKAPGESPRASGTETPQPVEDLERPISSRRPPSTLGMELRVRPEGGEIQLEAEVEFTIYTRHLPTFVDQRSSLGGGADAGEATGPQTLVEVCRRWRIRAGPIFFVVPSRSRIRLDDSGAIQQEIDRILDQACSTPDAMPDFERVPEVPQNALASEAHFRQWLVRIASGRHRIRPPLRAALTIDSNPQPDGTIRARIYVRNFTPSNPGKRSEDHYHILGDVSLTVRLIQGQASPVEILPTPEDYMYDRHVWAVGHNVSVEADADKRTFRTRALARYEQPRATMRASDDCRFDLLSQSPLEALERIRQEMEEYAGEWERWLAANERRLDSESLEACRRDLASFREEIGGLAAGSAAMATDLRLLEAFRAMNRVMMRVAGSRFDRWRLFQVVFIVHQLAALASREERRRNEHLETGEVLWIPTGGGKTEAYLGLICCSILYDRLRGKDRGVTAWLKLPLRMLSIQQLQRALRVIWETEKERQTLLGERASRSDPIRLGYFVGGGITPNFPSSEDLKRLTDEDLERYCIIPDCFACAGRKTIRVERDPENVRLAHRCAACGVELPLLIMDTEIYRFLPALIVGTVDKIATIGMQRRFRLLISGPEWRCRHGYGRGERCDFGCQGSKRVPVPAPYDPAPALHIQDELHLLQEELGAFAGHYETLLRHLAEEASGLPPKVIAATATIEGFEHQVQHLYGVRLVRRFPARGYERYRSFYMEPETDRSSAKIHRVFVGFRPAGGHPTDLAAWCAGALVDAVAEMIQDPYRGLAVLRGLGDEMALRRLLDLYSMALVYVGTLPGGTRAKEYLTHYHKTSSSNTREPNVVYLSSRSKPAEITEVIRVADNPPPWEDDSHLDAVVATNMISHGVDFEQMNLMVLDHFPAEVSEYIQATSRCGRKHVGLVVSILPAYSLRASSIYNRFREFHDHLERMVQPVPVNRFARRAAERTLPGVLCGLIMASTGLSRRDQALTLFRNAARQHLRRKLRRAYGLDRGAYEPDLEQMMAEVLEEAMQTQEFALKNSHSRDLWEAVRPHPMRSLRDIEPGVPFRPSPAADEHLLRQANQE